MGYNLVLACHTCRETTFALRGEEALVIKAFARRHPGRHLRDVTIDNGFMPTEDWPEYRDIYDELTASTHA